MPNQYDKILKENIANLFLPLSETEEIKDKFQRTIATIFVLLIFWFLLTNNLCMQTHT